MIKNIRDVQVRYGKSNVPMPKGTRFGHAGDLYESFRPT
jgi:hypothetical protein